MKKNDYKFIFVSFIFSYFLKMLMCNDINVLRINYLSNNLSINIHLRKYSSLI
jgi:hypothetical protein